MKTLEIFNQTYIVELNLSYTECAVNIEHIIRLLGYDYETVPEPVLESLESIIRILPTKVKMRSGFKIFSSKKVNIDHDKFTIYNQVFNCGNIIHSYLKDSDTVAFIISTLGDELESMSKKYMDSNEMLKGYLVDKIGSELVEKVTDKTEIYLHEYLDKYGLKITNRYSPGYCGWDVADQKKLFSLLPSNFCGVSINNDSMMNPVKSISAIIGIGENVKKNNYECSICDIDFCYRRDHSK